MIEDRFQRRYQNQSWLVRRWRDRWLLTAPWVAIRLWFSTRSAESLAKPDEYITRMPLYECWDLALGLVDGKRDYWYTSEEVYADLGLEEDDDASSLDS